MANISAIWQHAARITNRLSSPTAKQKPYKTKKTFLNEKHWRIVWEKNVRRMDKYPDRSRDRKSNGYSQKNNRGDSKVETNDSPEIQDRREIPDIPSLPSGSLLKDSSWGLAVGSTGKWERGLDLGIALILACFRSVRNTLLYEMTSVIPE